MRIRATVGAFLVMITSSPAFTGPRLGVLQAPIGDKAAPRPPQSIPNVTRLPSSRAAMLSRPPLPRARPAGAPAAPMLPAPMLPVPMQRSAADQFRPEPVAPLE